MREWTHWGDPALWCPTCERGWLPGTSSFDTLLKMNRTPINPQLPLWNFVG
ncbi:MAG: hypothetical protein U0Z75_05715 [Deinococcaceae bacterium]